MGGASAAAEPPKGHHLEARFWSHAQELAIRAGLGIATDCQTDLRRFIAGGVSQLQREGAHKDENRVNEAEANLRRFVERMIDEAKQRGVLELHEYTFGAARQSLCPIWPFC